MIKGLFSQLCRDLLQLQIESQKQLSSLCLCVRHMVDWRVLGGKEVRRDASAFVSMIVREPHPAKEALSGGIGTRHAWIVLQHEA